MNNFDFPFFFGGGQYQPDFSIADPGNVPPQPLPEAVAQHLATQGIRPGDFLSNPQAFMQQNPGMQFPPGNPNAAGPAGMMPPSLLSNTAPIQPNPVKTLSFTPPGGAVPAAPAAPTAPTATDANGAPVQTQELSAKQGQGDLAKRLTDTLKGIQAPAAPQTQRVYTPNPVSPGHASPLRGNSQIAALLQLIAGQKGQGQQIPLPLGALLAGRGL